MHSLVDILFGWPLFGFGVPILIGAAFAVLAFDEFKAALVCFWFSAAWIYGKVLMWSYVTGSDFRIRALVAFVVFGVIGVGLTEVTQLVKRLELAGTIPQSQQVPMPVPPTNPATAEPPNKIAAAPPNTVKETLGPKDQVAVEVQRGTADSVSATVARSSPFAQLPPSTVVMMPTYPAVEFYVSPLKILTIKNRGKYDVDEVWMNSTKYLLDVNALAANRVQIGSYSQSSGFELVKKIPAGTSDEARDLAKLPFFEITDFPPNQTTGLPDEFLRYYALRFSFIDKATGRRYVFYKVISGMRNNPMPFDNPTGVASSGTGKDVFWLHIPEVLIQHQKWLYLNDGEEYKP